MLTWKSCVLGPFLSFVHTRALLCKKRVCMSILPTRYDEPKSNVCFPERHNSCAHCAKRIITICCSMQKLLRFKNSKLVEIWVYVKTKNLRSVLHAARTEIIRTSPDRSRQSEQFDMQNVIVGLESKKLFQKMSRFTNENSSFLG